MNTITAIANLITAYTPNGWHVDNDTILVELMMFGENVEAHRDSINEIIRCAQKAGPAKCEVYDLHGKHWVDIQYGAYYEPYAVRISWEIYNPTDD